MNWCNAPPKSTVHRIIATAPLGAVEKSTVSNETVELPSVVVGKDGKQRQAVQPERKAPEPELPIAVRNGLEAGAEIPHLTTAVGADGKEYPRQVETARRVVAVAEWRD